MLMTSVWRLVAGLFAELCRGIAGMVRGVLFALVAVSGMVASQHVFGTPGLVIATTVIVAWVLFRAARGGSGEGSGDGESDGGGDGGGD